MTTVERRELLGKVDELVRQKYFDPKFNGRDWPAIVQEHQDRVVNAADDESFEGEMNLLLGKLGTSHTHFLSPRTKIPSRNSINATFRAVETESGKRWIFQDVQPGGPADQAGAKPGDILLSVNGQPVAPPTTPNFRMDSTAAIALKAVLVLIETDNVGGVLRELNIP